MEKGNISKIIRFSAVDGPGNRSIIFLQGCNFNCTYCHNPETINSCIHCGICVENCQVNALKRTDNRVVWDEKLCIECDQCIKSCPYSSSPKTKYMTAQEVMDYIGNAKAFIRGITVSGGEATLQRDFLCELFALAREEGLSCFIDSNGSYDFENDKELLELTDKVMLDVKAFNPGEHKAVTGQENTMVLKNLELLCRLDKLYEVRTVVVPDLYNVEETVREVARKIKAYQDVRYKLIKFRSNGVRKQYMGYSVPGDTYMSELLNIIREEGVINFIIV